MRRSEVILTKTDILIIIGIISAFKESGKEAVVDGEMDKEDYEDTKKILEKLEWKLIDGIQDLN